MATPMFPLQSVLLPGGALPLQIFEPRYMAMFDTIMRGDREFGVVLIERGSEVGGGDVRCDVATMARVVETQRLPDGRLLVGAVGERRIRVLRWLADDPYPRADTEPWPDEPDHPDELHEAPPDSERLQRELAELVAECRSLASAAHAAPHRSSAPIDLGADISATSYRAAVLAPLGPFDRYKVLCTPTAKQRLEVSHRLIGDAVELLRAQFA